MNVNKCANHPERRPVALCEKFERGYCLECFEEGVECSDPELYCKFRPQCLIWEDFRDKNREEKKAASA